MPRSIEIWTGAVAHLVLGACISPIESIGARGIEPASQETYGNGVREVIYRDPDGNEIGFGGARSSDRSVLTAA